MGYYKNHEGYTDITQGKAVQRADKLPPEVEQVIYVLRNVASLAGFDIRGRIWLVDKTTGKEWR